MKMWWMVYTFFHFEDKNKWSEGTHNNWLNCCQDQIKTLHHYSIILSIHFLFFNHDKKKRIPKGQIWMFIL